MSTNRNRLPEDWQELFVNRVRSVGAWCDASNGDKRRHYFICRNPKANIAISMCGQIIKPFDKLHENMVLIKCLICDLYITGNQEVQGKILRRHDATIEKLTQTLTQDKE